jgi:hypothetical protein
MRHIVTYLKGVVLGLPILATLGLWSGFFYPFDVVAGGKSEKLAANYLSDH